MNKKAGNGIDEKEYSLVVEMGDADFTESNRPGDLPKKKTVYTAGVAQKSRLVETLDRYDDFSQLQIPSRSYEKRGTYGIKRSATHAGDEIILDHQRKAAQKFLKELRGFGLLADIVGSGKTYEACVVLSELAARGRINSLLLIVPEQVYTKWVYVLEIQFGLGKGKLYQADSKLAERGDKNSRSFETNLDSLTVRNSDGFIIPTRPIIVSTEDFVKWPEDVCKVLFDAVVVDEAHHLCAEEGQYSHAMYRLSKLMEEKKRANKTYCILCSATPHSGDIEHMFRLWYFIRCNGGTPGDFEEKDDSRRTLKYRTEKEFYRTRVCHGASTVMEFIKRVKIEKTEFDYSAELKAFISARLSRGTHDKKLYEQYLNELNGSDYGESSLTDSEKFGVIVVFLRENPDIDGKVSDFVANEYHNGVLRSIMIRQANRVGKKRNVINIMFAPVTSVPKKMDLILPGRREKATVEISKMNDPGCVDYDDEKLSLTEYAGSFASDSYRHKMRNYASLVLNGETGLLPRMGMTNEVLGGDGELKHGEAIAYYLEQTGAISGDDIQMRFIPTVVGTDILSAKIAALKKIILDNTDKRIIVFFDYELKKNAAVYAAVEEALGKDSKIKDRVLIGRGPNKDSACATFEKTPGTVLLAEDDAYTEGVDLQESNIIVNFQVPPDPVAMDQRIGRIFRLGQKNDIYIYSLADMRALEGYVLMYFSRIGLLSSNSGDATIIAGCNNERSLTVRCKGCGKARMYDEEEYKRKDKADSDELYCADTDACIAESERGTRMEIIGTYDFKCDNCKEVITRSEDGYLCMSVNSAGKRPMCNCGDYNDRNIYCSKICAISHCRKFTEGAFKDKCNALKKYKSNPNASEAQLMAECDRCTRKCPPECRVAGGDLSGPDLIARCTDCPDALCKPKPHNLAFNAKWECRCPSCGTGTLKPVRAHTFADYVRSLWHYQFDKNEFGRRLSAEADKVASIKDILDKDK